MINLSTKYLGLELKNPLIVGSSGLTESVEKIIEYEKAGAGAIVLKSLFEEQIQFDTQQTFSYSETNNDYPEALDYITQYTEGHGIAKYLQLIREAKSSVEVPIIASVNCVSKGEWMRFAKDIELAGADAIELNIFALPSDAAITGEDYEKIYFDIITEIKKVVTIPVAVKLGYYFSGLVNTLQKISWSGIQGMVLFNRFFKPDIDINTLKVVPSSLYSSKDELMDTLRWVALLSNDMRCDISASTGVHNAEGLIKMLLAGADTVQICSVLYKEGPEAITSILSGLEKWMQEHQYESVSQFRGKLNVKNFDNPAQFYRVQYMKYHSGIE